GQIAGPPRLQGKGKAQQEIDEPVGEYDYDLVGAEEFPHHRHTAARHHLPTNSLYHNRKSRCSLPPRLQSARGRARRGILGSPDLLRRDRPWPKCARVRSTRPVMMKRRPTARCPSWPRTTPTEAGARN